MTPRQLTALKLFIFFASLIPLARLVVGVINDSLGANPIETITHQTGTWTFNFLLFTLTVTPLRKIADWPWLIRTRRMLGLFTFFYAGLHFTTYIWLDQFFDPAAIAKDILKRPFITVGFAAFVLLIPLALTSTNGAIKRMGGRRWQQLHHTVYAIGILAAIHYFWLVKPVALPYPLSYALILLLLLGWRARERIRRFGPFPDRESNPKINAPTTAIIRFMPRPPKH